MFKVKKKQLFYLTFYLLLNKAQSLLHVKEHWAAVYADIRICDLKWTGTKQKLQ